MSATRLTRTRFEALCYSRNPFVESISDEHEWWANAEEKNLGIVVFEHPDQQWFWIILGRDERGVFRCVDMNHSIDTQAAASAELQMMLTEWETRSEVDSFQGDVKSKKNEIFVTKADDSKLDPVYKFLDEKESYSPARGLIKELAFAFTDLDGNYIKDFQTTGFNARLWELYLFALLYEQRFTISNEFNRPDFVAIKCGFTISIEATTVNPTKGVEAPSSITLEERRELLKNYMPIKFGSVLFSKMKKRYWELPHMKGVPLILAVHDFHSDDSMTWTAPALQEYLYGLRSKTITDENGVITSETFPISEHVWGDKKIPSGFFSLPDAINISAVLFSNAATLSKFNRIGKIAGFGDPNVQMQRIGDRWNPDPNATFPIPFMVKIEPGKYFETWSEGIRIFHNPSALNPILPELFPHCSHHSIEDGSFINVIPDHFIFNSKTIILNKKESSFTGM